MRGDEGGEGREGSGGRGGGGGVGMEEIGWDGMRWQVSGGE